MGFESDDESTHESDSAVDEGFSTAEREHDGTVEFEFDASNDELLDTLKDIKENT